MTVDRAKVKRADGAEAGAEGPRVRDSPRTDGLVGSSTNDLSNDDVPKNDVPKDSRRKNRSGRLTRRALTLGGLGSLACMWGPPAHAFGEEGAFHPRVLLTGASEWAGHRKTAPSRWALEVVRRTSAPARLSPGVVRADSPQLLAEPFAIWSGKTAPDPLTRSELTNLRRFIALGGLLVIDEVDPRRGEFVEGAEKQIKRVLPQASPIAIGEENVIFRSFYLLEKAGGRIQKETKLRAVVRGGFVQVLLCPNDLLGALARDPGGVHPFEVEPGGERQREMSSRLAVNIAMYVLCTNYKDDQVHAPFLMRRRATERP